MLNPGCSEGKTSKEDKKGAFNSPVTLQCFRIIRTTIAEGNGLIPDQQSANKTPDQIIPTHISFITPADVKSHHLRSCSRNEHRNPSFSTFHLHFPRRLSGSSVCTANTCRPTYVLLCQLIDICRNCLEPVCAFCRGAKLKNIGAGSVQGKDFKTVGPGGAQRSKLDRSAAED